MQNQAYSKSAVNGVNTVNNVTESHLQGQCFQWHWNTRPSERGQLFMIYNNPKNAAHGSMLKAMGMIAGCSDLVYLAPGGSIHFLECKLPEGVQSRAQKTFEARVTALGHRYSIFRSLEEFQALLT